MVIQNGIVWTHEGRIVGCDARTPDGYSRLVRLRETKTLWIDANGQKWSKARLGIPAGSNVMPRYRLDLSSVQTIT